MKLMTLILWVLICGYASDVQSQTNDSEKVRFHDFKFKLEGLSHVKSEDYKFETFTRRHKNNSKIGFVLKSDSLRYIKSLYDNQDGQIIVQKDTLIVILSDEELDELYVKCVNNFQIKPNLTLFRIPPPPPIFDGISAQLEFELRFRGGKYIKLINQAGFNDTKDKDFNDLLIWLTSLY